MPSLWHTLLPNTSNTKRMIVDFVDRVGLVYFGFVSQRSDDHHIVRGMTVSNKHHDDHYCIGTFDGYDIIFVERSDSLLSGKKHVWHIMEFDLHSKVDLPHTFIGSSARTHGFHELMGVKFSRLTNVLLGHTADYPTDFKTHFSVHASAENVLAVERLITDTVAETLASHFKGLAVEISDTSLYVYSEQSHLTPKLLDTMLQNGAWLATALDENSRQLQ